MPDSPNRFKLLLDDTEYSDPENWSTFTPSTQRHPVYRTLLTQFSEGVVILLKDAKDYIDSIYALKGATQTIDVKWQEYNVTTGVYDNVYAIGRLDMMAKYERERDYTKVGFEPTDFISNFLNRDEIRLDLQKLFDIDGNAITPFTDEYHTIVLDAQTINKTLQVTETESITDSFLYGLNSDVSGGSKSIVVSIGEDTVVINELPDSFTQRDSFFYEDNTTGISSKVTPSEGGSFTLELTYDIDLGMSLGISGEDNGYMVSGSFNLTVQLRIGTRNDTTLITDTVLVDSDTNAYSASGNISGVPNIAGSYSSAVTVEEGESIVCYASIVATNINGDGDAVSGDFAIERTFYFDSNTWDLNITEVLNNADTNCNVMLPWEYLLRMCQQITGRNDCLRSEFFGRTDGEVYTYAGDGEGAFYAITTGGQIRAFPIADNPINSSFREGFNGLNALFLLGVGVTYESGVPYIEIEPLVNMMDKTTTVATFTAEDTGIKWRSATQYIWGNVKAGYNEYKNDDNWILGTPHSPRVYTVPYISNATDNEYLGSNEMSASGHLIENLRLNPYSLGTEKDTDYDNKLFVIHCKRDGAGGYERVTNDGFSLIAGLSNSTTQYNMNITPARNIIRHAPMILCGLAKRILETSTFNEYLDFQSGEANYGVRTIKGGAPGSIYIDAVVSSGTINAFQDIYFGSETGTVIFVSLPNVIVSISLDDIATSGSFNTPTSSGTYSNARDIGNVIYEDDDLTISQAAADDQLPLFDASEMGVCTVKITKAQRQLISEGLKGQINIIDGDNSYSGFIEEIKEVNLNENIAEIKFLSTEGIPTVFYLLEESGDKLLEQSGDSMLEERSDT